MDECMIALPAFCAGQRDGCRLKVFKYDQLCRVNFCGLRQVFAGKDQRWSKRLRFDLTFLQPLAAPPKQLKTTKKYFFSPSPCQELAGYRPDLPAFCAHQARRERRKVSGEAPSKSKTPILTRNYFFVSI
ncbi:MAG: hypothetical protein K9I74_10110 [Bacteroidales bacterium]|nr:hypothetical protein [Bacteroidales bacterium]